LYELVRDNLETLYGAIEDGAIAVRIPKHARTFPSLAPPADWTCTTPSAGGTGAVACTTPLLAAGASATFALELDVACEVPVGTAISNTEPIVRVIAESSTEEGARALAERVLDEVAGWA
jgi:hypothetical protein